VIVDVGRSEAGHRRVERCGQQPADNRDGAHRPRHISQADAVFDADRAPRGLALAEIALSLRHAPPENALVQAGALLGDRVLDAVVDELLGVVGQQRDIPLHRLGQVVVQGGEPGCLLAAQPERAAEKGGQLAALDLLLGGGHDGQRPGQWSVAQLVPLQTEPLQPLFGGRPRQAVFDGFDQSEEAVVAETEIDAGLLHTERHRLARAEQRRPGPQVEGLLVALLLEAVVDFELAVEGCERGGQSGDGGGLQAHFPCRPVSAPVHLVLGFGQFLAAVGRLGEPMEHPVVVNPRGPYHVAHRQVLPGRRTPASAWACSSARRRMVARSVTVMCRCAAPRVSGLGMPRSTSRA